MEARVQTPRQSLISSDFIVSFSTQFTNDDHFVTCDHPMVEVKTYLSSILFLKRTLSVCGQVGSFNIPKLKNIPS